MAGSLVTRWRTWRAKRREEMLERLGLQIERGGAPIAGGYGFSSSPSPSSSRSPLRPS
jgi:hypothetical protein